MKVLSLALFAAVAMFADTIVSETPGGTSGSSSGFFAVSWILTSTWDNVKIQAPLESDTPNSATGTAYLSNKLGAGAVAGNVLDTFAISTNNNDPSALLTLFSGLTLGPGTYFLSLQDGGDLFSIGAGSPVQTLGSGVTQGPDLMESGPIGTPPISSAFSDSTGKTHLLFTVTGDPVANTTTTPEPSMILILTLGLGGIVGVRRLGRGGVRV